MAFDVNDPVGTMVSDLEDEIGAHQNELVDVVARLVNQLSEQQDLDGASINRIQRKLSVSANKEQVDDSDRLTVISNALQQILDVEQTEHGSLLRDIAVKCAWINPGEDLPDILRAPGEQGPALRYGGTLVLSVREAIPWMEKLINVLEEIRDKMSVPSGLIPASSPIQSQELVTENQIKQPMLTSVFVPPPEEDEWQE